MSIKLTDAQLVMLSKAAQRTDRCLTPPSGLRGATLSSVEVKLLAGGLVKAIKATAAAPVWRRDEVAGTNVALKLTAAGLKAIAVDADQVEQDIQARDANALEVRVQPVASAKGQRGKAKVATQGSTPGLAGNAQTAPAALRPNDPSKLNSATTGPFGRESTPRPGTKLAEVIGLLSRSNGATIADLIAATGWLSHTTRAALTGLRQRGYVIGLDRSNRAGGSVYRIGTIAGRDDKVQAAEAVAGG